jgi:hypothetical protein
VAKQAAEKGRLSSDMPERHTSGAKARRLFCCICGTTEVVPFQDIIDYRCGGHHEREFLIAMMIQCRYRSEHAGTSAEMGK